MFAVKGWSVDAAALKPQTEIFKSRKNGGEDEGKDGKPSRKRKRGEGPSEQSADVGKLWDKHIEGNEPAKGKKAFKKQRKKQKLETVAGGKDEETGDQDAPEKRKDAGHTESSTPANGGVKKSKKDRKRDRGQHKSVDGPATGNDDAKAAAKTAPPAAPPLPATAKLTPMQAAMRQKLVSARFRHLNQTLYTAPSVTSLELFDQNPEMFEDYHAGFRQQVSVWPENPLDNFVATLRSRGQVKPPRFKDKKSRGQPASPPNGGGAQVLPRTHGTCIVADLGCGDARLAQMLKDSGDMSKFSIKVHSYDLHSPSPLVTKADMANLPLQDGSVDVALFCLALMGTNWISFIEEAYRVLHWKGELWVAEIKSRFGRVGRAGKPVEHSVGSKKKQAALKKVREEKEKEAVDVDEQTVLKTEVDGVETGQQETDVSAFVDVLRRRGFVLKDGEKSVDLSNKMFVKMEFIKAAAPTKGKGVSAAAAAEGGRKPMHSKKKFVEEAAEEIATDDEAKVLKPCLYKIR